MARPRYLLVCLLPMVSLLVSVVAGPNAERCSLTVRSWSETQLLVLSSLPGTSPSDRVKLRNLLFFLHVPRTGGRTFHQCFFKHLLGSDQRCPRSYDKLRFDRTQPGCRLISTHDDYSLLDKLSQEMTSVVTSLREPVDRVLSAYEFSIEVAARSLKIPRKKSGGMYSRSTPRLPIGSTLMSTLDIWPWKYLVPTMQQDMFSRRDAKLGPNAKAGQIVGRRVSELSANNSYDSASLTMPFHEFIHHPVALELVHNGATFQVAGLTNISYSEEAGDVRACVVKFPSLGAHVLAVAKKRLDNMLYVGLTERQKDAAVFFAKVIGKQVSMERWLRSLLSQTSKSSRLQGRVPRVPHNFTSIDELNEDDVIEELVESYQDCVAHLRKSQDTRRAISLQMIAPIKFSRERRGFIPKDVIDEVARLNSLDAELYSHAERIFAQQQDLLERGKLNLHNEEIEFVNMSRKSYADDVGDMGEYGYLWEAIKESFFMLTLALLVTLVLTGLLIYLVKHRRGARVKET